MFIVHLIDFLPKIIKDIKQVKNSPKKRFRPYGMRIYCGRQGSGKTVSMVRRAREIHEKYPNCKIVTNFDCSFADVVMTSLNDLLTIRNGIDGVLFVIDEIQNEFSSATSKDFPETLLSVITMQRKQCIHILASSQVFTRVSKPLREQCYEVVECRTFLGRWTSNKVYDAEDYNAVIDNPDPSRKFKLPKKEKFSFIQDDALRESYDTYSIIRRLSRVGFVTKIK